MFNLANLFTALNLMGGIVSVMLSISGHVELAPLPLFASMIFDFLDGFVARLLKINSALGKQLDSLSDMVSFGVAPGFMMMAFIAGFEDEQNGIVNWLDQLFNGTIESYAPFAGLLIPFFALFRLAKFNVDEKQSDQFLGIPTPAATLFFVSFPLANYWEDAFGVTGLLSIPLLVLLTLVISVMMVVPVPLIALKFKSFGIKENTFRYIFLLISLIFIPVFRVWSLSLIVFLYLIISIIQNTFFKAKHHEIQSGN